MDSQAILLSLIVFLPVLGALGLLLAPISTESIRWTTLGVTLAVFALTVVLATGGADTGYVKGVAQLQSAFSWNWISSFNIYYFMGVDGISMTLLLLTSFLSVLAMGASWNIAKHVKAYCVLFLLLETGMLGVFLSLDFFLFYVFWEVMLLPMYFLIGVWGGPRREYAAIKFFLYTLLGSVFMLIAILMLYFNSDLVELARHSTLVESSPHQAVPWDQLHLHADVTKKVTEQLAKAEAGETTRALHTFNIQALAQMGQHTGLFDDVVLFGKSVQWWSFLLLFVGFAIKVPAFPVHTWLPDAHVEAPTPISMILAGVLLKMGGYGIIRICYPICPQAGYELAWFVTAIGATSMVYGAFAALAQKDFKRLVAYSSVSHMGYVTLGLGVWSATAANGFNPDYWAQGVNGAMFQMLAHGISSAGMFFMVGVIYDRVHHRNLDDFGGLFARMPVYSGMAFALFFAGLGLPGLCGFIGEVYVTLSVWSYSQALAIVSASTVILTASYILWTLQRVYLGSEYKGPHGDRITPTTLREVLIGAPLVALAVLFGVQPKLLFDHMEPSLTANVRALADWSARQPVAAESAGKPAAAERSATAEVPAKSGATTTNDRAIASQERK